MAGRQPGNSDVRVLSSRRLEPAAARREPLRLRTALTHALDDRLRALVARVFGNAPLAFLWADGSVLATPRERAVASIVFRDRLTLLRVLADPDAAFGELYAEGAVDVRGDLVAALEAAYRAVDAGSTATWRLALPGAHCRRFSRHNVHRHYDLGNDFYRLWLDEQLVYTCAYFPSPDSDLDAAQFAKMDLVCRKLRLRPGERVVEAGCGWGALALHMARHYGVSVRAYNVSREQLRHARQRAWREGLADQVEFIDDDYRNALGPADVFVSVGMLEHVGLENFGTLGAVIDRCLPPGRGRGLLHFIGRDQPRPLSAWIRRRIFPGAYAPTLSQVLSRVVEPGGLSVLHVENLRLHYARTLALWRARFEAAFDTVETQFGREFARAWRLYLAGSEAAFRTGSLQLFQVTFARRGDEDMPWTRAAPLREGSPAGDGSL
jgi:cyclopropane-fatty-acyl-phospholipid synthase